jgi:hypothetical protein
MSEEGMPTAGLQIQPESEMPEATIESRESNAIETPMGDPPSKESQELIAGKFKTQDDLLNAYKELESKLGKYRQESAQSTIDEIIAAAGLNGADLAANFNTDGQLSEDQYEAFKKVGFSKDVVNTFLRGQQAIAQNSVYAQERIRDHAIKMVGGEQQLQGLLRWASTNLPEARTEELNQRLASPAQYESALKELLFDYQAASGRLTNQNEILSGQAMPNTSRGFESSEEMIAALKKAEKQGYYDESFKRRMANTAKHIITGAQG